MDTKTIAEEIKALSKMLSRAQKKLAKQIPVLAGTNITCHHLSNVKIVGSGLSRYAAILMDASNEIKQHEKT